MSYIYKITNDINNKIYIGKTEFSIEKRFKEHCQDAFRARSEKRPLYSAMRKYGIEHFKIELIEETNEPEIREIFWIEFYDSFKNGYNATRGGDGKCLYNHEAILERLQIFPYPKKVSEEFGCCVDLIYDIAHKNNIQLINSSNEKMSQSKKNVIAYTKDGEFIQEFISTVEAAKWCFESGRCKVLNSGVRAHISEVANGKRKTAYGLSWKYKE